MWADKAPWQKAALKVQVIGIVHWWLDNASDEQILRVFQFARRHHMKVEMETAVVARYSKEACGHTEGYTAPETLPAEIAILKRLNLHLDIITMDEPLWFGHYNPDRSSCSLSVSALVDRITSNTKAILAQYPDIQIVDIEPLPAITNYPDWKKSVSTFQEMLLERMGKTFHALQVDVDWESPGWVAPLREMRVFTGLRQTALGLYFNGMPFARSDREWIDSAESHFDAVEGQMGILPDQAIFATWAPYPAHNMPETSPTTQTWLINRYSRERH